MASVTIKSFPDDLHRDLKLLAKRDGRSLNQEILQHLRIAVSAAPTIPAEAARLAGLRQLRERLAAQGMWVTEEEINRDKRGGRP